MSEKDKLDVFIDSQLVVNQGLQATLKGVGEAVVELEKHSIEMKQLVSIVNAVKKDIKINADDIAELKLNSSFVKDAKWVFRAVILALIVGAGTAVWQIIKSDQVQPLSISDVELIIKTIQSKADK